MTQETTSAVVTFVEVLPGDPPCLHYRDDARRPDGKRRVIECAVEIRDPELLARARDLAPGATIRVTEADDWDDPDLPCWLTGLETIDG